MASAMPHISAAGGSAGARAHSSSAAAAGRSDSASSFVRTPMFTKPLDDDEHAAMNKMRKGVLQVFVHKVKNTWKLPWSKARPSASRGSGFIVDLDKKLIVTNAHVAAFASTIEVRIDGDDDKYEARVLAVAHQVDIAILEEERRIFFVAISRAMRRLYVTFAEEENVPDGQGGLEQTQHLRSDFIGHALGLTQLPVAPSGAAPPAAAADTAAAAALPPPPVQTQPRARFVFQSDVRGNADEGPQQQLQAAAKAAAGSAARPAAARSRRAARVRAEKARRRRIAARAEG